MLPRQWAMGAQNRLGEAGAIARKAASWRYLHYRQGRAEAQLPPQRKKKRIERRMNCLFTTAGGRKAEPSEPVGGYV